MYSKARYLSVIVLSIAIAFVVAQCGPSTPSEIEEPTKISEVGEEEQPTAKPEEEVPVVRGGTLRSIYSHAPDILNPHLAVGMKDFETSRVFYEPLASFTSDGEMVLFLAKEIPTFENGGLSEDGRSVTWKLREGVKWHDGEPFSAEDVAFTFEYVSDPAVGATSYQSYALIDTVEVIDNYTVKIIFKDVNPAWYDPFVGVYGQVIPKHIFENYMGERAREAPQNLSPVGTGPFRIVEFKPGDVIVAEAFPEYWDEGKPYFEELVIKGGVEQTTAVRAVLQTGDTDYVVQPSIEPELLEDLVALGNGRLLIEYGPKVERIDFNFTDPNMSTEDGERSNLQFPHPFFSDARVRKAFSYALDRWTIVEQIYGPEVQVTCNVLVSPPRFDSPSECEYDLGKAAQLLDEAGWIDHDDDGIRDKDGVKMSVLFQTTVQGPRQKAQEIYKQALQEIGVEVELRSIEGGVFFSADPTNPDTIRHFYADLEMWTNAGFSPWPAAFMAGFTCDAIPQKTNDYKGENISRFCSTEYDNLLSEASSELDPEMQNEMFKRLNDILVNEQVVAMPIFQRAVFNIASNRIVGIENSVWDGPYWDIKEWREAQ